MKNILRKSLYIILMVTMIITSFTPYSTKATGSFDGAHNEVVPQDEKEYITSKDGVTISKHITRNDVENYFDIELKVTTESKVEEIPVPPSSVAIELVIDNSNSMNFCMSKPGQSTCTSSDRRMKYLKEALTKNGGFIDQFVESASTARTINEDVVRELGVITFNKSGTEVTTLTNYHSGTKNYGSNWNQDYKTYAQYFKDTIDNLGNSSGTFPSDGLKLATAALSKSNADYKYIIFLTDGYPTINKSGSTNTSTYNDTGARLGREAADAAKAAGIQIFSIGVGVDQQPAIINGKYDGTGYDGPSAERGGYEYEVGYSVKFKNYTYSNSTTTTPTNNTKYFLAQSNSNSSQVLGINENKNNFQNSNLSSTSFNDRALWQFEKVNGGYKIKNVSTGEYLKQSDNKITFDGTGSDIVFTINIRNNKVYFSYSSGRSTYYLTTNGGLTTSSNSRGNFYLLTYNPNYDYTSAVDEFENWLGGHAVDGVNEDGTPNKTNRGIAWNKDPNVKTYYSVRTGNTDLSGVYNSIFTSISREVEKYSDAWKVDDSMNSQKAVAMPTDIIEFVGFYNDANTEVILNNDGTPKLTSEQTGSANVYSFSDNSISWDLRRSIPTTKKDKDSSGKEITYYTYTLNYRIRIKNENPDKSFTEEDLYHTNGEAILSYYHATKDKDDNITYSEVEKMSFYNPQVVARTNKLTFEKISSYDNKPLEGVEFKLYLNQDGTNTSEKLSEPMHIDKNYSMTAFSDENGDVTFTNIPSGYDYYLEEVNSIDGYTKDSTKYNVHVVDGNITYDVPETVTNDVNYYNLVIKKVIKPNNERNTNAYIDTNREFSFTITVDDTNAVSYNAIVNGKTNKVIKLNNRVGEFTLKHNDEISISIPYGVNYVITETEYNGYNVIYDNNKEGTIDLTNSIVIVTNKKVPTNIKVKKVWENIKDYASIPKVEVTLQRSLDNKTWEDAKDNKGNVLKATIDTSVKDYAEWNNLDGDYAYRVVETNVIGEDKEVYTIDYKYDDKSGTWTITNTDNRIAVLPEAGSSGGLILASLAFVFITMPVMYTAYNLYIEKRWF